MICNKIHGRTQHRILAFLMSLRVVERPIWLVRAGPIECEESDLPGPLPAGSSDPGAAAPHSPSGGASLGAGGAQGVSRRRYNSDLALEPPFSEAEAAEAEAEAAGGQTEEGESVPEEDDYWASFHGRASWQREPPPPPAGGRVAYSWPPAQKASTCSWLIALAHLATCSERTLALRLPPQSVHGASLNEQGCFLARRVGKLIAAEGRKFRRPPPHIFTRHVPAARPGAGCCCACAAGRVAGAPPPASLPPSLGGSATDPAAAG